MTPNEKTVALALIVLAAGRGGFGLLVAAVIVGVCIATTRRRKEADASRRADLHRQTALLSALILGEAAATDPETANAPRIQYPRSGTPTQEMPMWQRRKIAATARKRPPASPPGTGHDHPSTDDGAHNVDGVMLGTGTTTEPTATEAGPQTGYYPIRRQAGPSDPTIPVPVIDRTTGDPAFHASAPEQIDWMSPAGHPAPHGKPEVPYADLYADPPLGSHTDQPAEIHDDIYLSLPLTVPIAVIPRD